MNTAAAHPRKPFLAALLALWVGATTVPAAASTGPFLHEFGIGPGTAQFRSDESGRIEGEALQLSLRLDRKVAGPFFIGALVDLADSFCPICDEAPVDKLRTLALTFGTAYRYKALSLQAGTGLGYAEGKYGEWRNGRRETRTYTGLQAPFLVRAGLLHDFRSVGLGAGLELKYHLTYVHDAWVVSLPLLIAF